VHILTLVLFGATVFATATYPSPETRVPDGRRRAWVGAGTATDAGELPAVNPPMWSSAFGGTTSSLFA
jgi:hypothetical protein